MSNRTKVTRRWATLASLMGVLALPAHAQSSVTLYGILDEGLQFNSNNKHVVDGRNVGGRQWNLNSLSGPHGSRWGLQGKEDLGGGTSAVFRLESGVNLNTGAFGQGGTAFGRQAWVGLRSQRFGSILLGRQYDAVADYVAHFAFELSGYGGIDHPGDLDNFGHTSHINNAVKYVSPNFNGLTFGGMVEVGGVPGSVSRNSGFALGARYVSGPLKLGAAYEVFKNPSNVGAALNGDADAEPPETSSAFGSLNAGYLTGARPATSWQVAAVAGTYSFGPARLGMAWSNVRYGDIGRYGGATATFNDIEASAIYRFTPTLSGGLDYSYLKGNAVSGEVGDQTYHQAIAIVNYALSRRTNLYGSVTVQLASGTNSLGAPAVANISGMGDSSNNRQLLMRLGLRHSF